MTGERWLVTGLAFCAILGGGLVLWLIWNDAGSAEAFKTACEAKGGIPVKVINGTRACAKKMDDAP